MTAPRPWDTGDVDANWDGYFIPGTDVLRNRVGATTWQALADAENDLVEIRVAELRDDPSPVARTYDLAHLQALHRFLFQDLFEWAGELRTVGIEKGDEPFASPAEIIRPVAYIADRIARSNRLRSIASDRLPADLADMYDYINTGGSPLSEEELSAVSEKEEAGLGPHINRGHRRLGQCQHSTSSTKMPVESR